MRICASGLVRKPKLIRIGSDWEWSDVWFSDIFCLSPSPSTLWNSKQVAPAVHIYSLPNFASKWPATWRHPCVSCFAQKESYTVLLAITHRNQTGRAACYRQGKRAASVALCRADGSHQRPATGSPQGCGTAQGGPGNHAGIDRISVVSDLRTSVAHYPRNRTRLARQHSSSCRLRQIYWPVEAGISWHSNENVLSLDLVVPRRSSFEFVPGEESEPGPALPTVRPLQCQAHTTTHWCCVMNRSLQAYPVAVTTVAVYGGAEYESLHVAWGRTTKQTMMLLSPFDRAEKTLPKSSEPCSKRCPTTTSRWRFPSWMRSGSLQETPRPGSHLCENSTRLCPDVHFYRLYLVYFEASGTILSVECVPWTGPATEYCYAQALGRCVMRHGVPRFCFVSRVVRGFFEKEPAAAYKILQTLMCVCGVARCEGKYFGSPKGWTGVVAFQASIDGFLVPAQRIWGVASRFVLRVGS